jgi:hypothetical protein
MPQKCRIDRMSSAKIAQRDGADRIGAHLQPVRAGRTTMRRSLAIGVLVLACSIGSAQAAINFEDVAVASGTEVFNSVDVISSLER